MNKRLNTYGELLELAFDPELREEYRKALSWADMYKENTKTIREMLALFHDTQQNGRVLVDYAGNPFIVI